ncbi:hypothetical protein HWV23_14535 [Natronomonas halophila]|uniref:hypothetical protein n=1 Tax=Natronomonas halophila TaxID=2747817 RepID=UPI0015B6ACCB|nr:hypothetical protein [Natronomonas halophila]QLD86890.1 hypothetical protein HWV23_14535 [Natronomonas halophila]
MDRPALLAVPTLCIAAIVVPLRSLPTFRVVRESLDMAMLSLSTKLLWTTVAVVGFAAVGYAYGSTANDDPPSVLGVAAIAAFVGVVAGYLFLWSLPSTSMATTSVYLEALTVGTYSLVDALMFGLLVLGGYALPFGARNR